MYNPTKKEFYYLTQSDYEDLIESQAQALFAVHKKCRAFVEYPSNDIALTFCVKALDDDDSDIEELEEEISNLKKEVSDYLEKEDPNNFMYNMRFPSITIGQWGQGVWLNYLATKNLIPEGNYIIDISW